MNGYKEFCCVTKSEKRLDNNVYLFPNASSGNTEIGWQGGRVVRVLDFESVGPGFESHSEHFMDLFLGCPEL